MTFRKDIILLDWDNEFTQYLITINNTLTLNHILTFTPFWIGVYNYQSTND